MSEVLREENQASEQALGKSIGKAIVKSLDFIPEVEESLKAS